MKEEWHSDTAKGVLVSYFDTYIWGTYICTRHTIRKLHTQILFFEKYKSYREIIEKKKESSNKCQTKCCTLYLEQRILFK